MGRHVFEIALDGKYPRFIFADEFKEFAFAPCAAWHSDMIANVLFAIREVLRGVDAEPVWMFDEPAKWELSLVREAEAVSVSVRMRTSARQPWAEQFGAAYPLARLARDAARCVKDLHAKGELVSNRSVQLADSILAILRGEDAGAWGAGGQGSDGR